MKFSGIPLCNVIKETFRNLDSLQDEILDIGNKVIRISPNTFYDMPLTLDGDLVFTTTESGVLFILSVVLLTFEQ